MLAQWDDMVGPDAAWLPDRCGPVYSRDELIALREFHQVWTAVCAGTLKDMPPIEELIGTPVWQSLCDAAAKTLIVMQRRGKFSENEEIFEA